MSKKGYIYCIRCHEEPDLVYVGSTTQRLCKRFSDHRTNYKLFLKGKYHNVSSFKVVKYETAYIELIDTVFFDEKEELRAIEGKYIREMDCVNTRVDGRTSKQYYIDNKEKILQSHKEYRDTHKEEIIQKRKDVVLVEKKRLYDKKYREEHIEELREKDRKTYVCDVCGSTSALQHKARHEKTAKHIKKLEELNANR